MPQRKNFTRAETNITAAEAGSGRQRRNNITNNVKYKNIWEHDLGYFYGAIFGQRQWTTQASNKAVEMFVLRIAVP